LLELGVNNTNALACKGGDDDDVETGRAVQSGYRGYVATNRLPAQVAWHSQLKSTLLVSHLKRMDWSGRAAALEFRSSQHKQQRLLCVDMLLL
jgi:hypothetical protein